MNSVERIRSYNEVEQDVVPSGELTKVKKSWPKYGEIEFRDFSMRYFPDKPLVLNNINVVIGALHN